MRRTPFIVISVVAGCILGAASVSAAEVTLTATPTHVAPGSEVLVRVSVSSKGTSVNAFAGTLVVPQDEFDIVSVEDGSSIVSLWLTPPTVSTSSVIFSGITPAGYEGEDGLLFSVRLRARREGSAALSLTDIDVLQNNGKGTAVPVTTNAPLSVVIDAQGSTAPSPEDTTPPEPFTLQLVHDPVAFGGERALVFATQDKGVGMSYYLVCEGLFGACVRAASGYVLTHQAADVLLTVHAVDLAGNVRTERLLTPAAMLRYSIYGVLVLLAGIGAWILLVRARMRL